MVLVWRVSATWKREGVLALAVLIASEAFLAPHAALGNGSPPTAAGPPGKKAAAAPAPVASAPPIDQRRENKQLVRRYLTEVLAAGRVDTLSEIVAKDFVDTTPGAPKLRGPAAVREKQRNLRSLFLKVEYEPQQLIAEDDWVAARYVVHATPRPEEGAPPPKPLVLHGITLFRVHGGRIQEAFVVNDQVSFLRQLGYTLVPPDASPPEPSPPPPSDRPPVHPPRPEAAPSRSRAQETARSQLCQGMTVAGWL